ncbi:MAG TPA: cytochrome c [Pyrinomonadaceae bacterium]|jgi:cytochrome c6|nr:cytochrome c [Pyrinomonadaceae bacterium]
MKFIKLALLMASLSLFVIACNNTTNSNGPANTGTAPTPSATSTARTAASPTPAADEFAHTSAIYGQNCAICHGDAGKGGTVDIEGKKLKVPSLIEGHTLKAPDEHYVKQITKGGEGMPAFKDKLKPEEINELVRYIRQKLQAGAATPASNANAVPAAPRS